MPWLYDSTHRGDVGLHRQQVEESKELNSEDGVNLCGRQHQHSQWEQHSEIRLVPLPLRHSVINIHNSRHEWRRTQRPAREAEWPSAVVTPRKQNKVWPYCVQMQDLTWINKFVQFHLTKTHLLNVPGLMLISITYNRVERTGKTKQLWCVIKVLRYWAATSCSKNNYMPLTYFYQHTMWYAHGYCSQCQYWSLRFHTSCTLCLL